MESGIASRSLGRFNPVGNRNELSILFDVDMLARRGNLRQRLPRTVNLAPASPSTWIS
jgi:hypothetical protein